MLARSHSDPTGQDGLARARQCITDRYGDDVADRALEPLTIAAVKWGWLDSDLEVGERTWCRRHLSRQRLPLRNGREAALSLSDWILSDPCTGDLATRLQALLAAWRAENGDLQGDATLGALAAVRLSIQVRAGSHACGARQDATRREIVQMVRWTPGRKRMTDRGCPSLLSSG